MDNEVVQGIIILYHSCAKVLFDTRASHSFMSIMFANSLKLKLSIMLYLLVVNTPVNGRVTVRTICRKCTLEVAGFVHKFDLILLEMIRFDIIIGMDRLSRFKARVDCHKKKVIFEKPNDEKIKFNGDRCTPTAMESIINNTWA